MSMVTGARLVALGLAVCLAGCADPGYRFAAERHAHKAEIAGQGATADEAAARLFAKQGNQSEAQESEDSAAQFRSVYENEQFQAAKDRWLSQWWPAPPR